MQITEQNAANFINAKVRFDYGCMYGSELGWVVGHETTRWGTELLCMTEAGKLKKVANITERGIGCHLIESEVA